MSERKIFERAQKTVKQRKSFLRHVFSWVVLSIFFILLNLSTSDYFWAIFPILGWGIGVAFHGIRVFSNEWENQEIDKEYERLRRRDLMKSGFYEEDFRKESGNKDKWSDDDFV